MRRPFNVRLEFSDEEQAEAMPSHVSLGHVLATMPITTDDHGRRWIRFPAPFADIVLEDHSTLRGRAATRLLEAVTALQRTDRT